MKKAATIVVGACLVVGTAALVALRATERQPTLQLAVWNETKWPYSLDQWGTGRTFVCLPADCGTKVELSIRPKIGFCNCATGVSDDAELERVADTELVSREVRPRGVSHAIKVGWMYGLSRVYRPSDEETNEGLLSIAFNDECDVVVALARLGDSGVAANIEPAVMEFLNSTSMVLWTKKELGLEFVRRDW